jgi:hypothetical protein
MPDGDLVPEESEEQLRMMFGHRLESCEFGVFAVGEELAWISSAARLSSSQGVLN